MDTKKIIKKFKKVRKSGSLGDVRKLEIAYSLFNKFGTAVELAEYLESKGVDVE